jgi:hypothetical protein
MALMYPWATKEYLLWKMSLGQIVLYHNIGSDLKNGIGSNGKHKSMVGKTYAEVKKKRDELIEQGYIEGKKQSEENKEHLREKYGDI